MLSQFRSLNSDEAFFESANSRVHFGALTAHDYCNFLSVAKWMQLQKKERDFCCQFSWSLVVTGLGFTSFFTRRLAVYKLLRCAEVYQFIVLYCETNAIFLTVQKGKQKGEVI